MNELVSNDNGKTFRETGGDAGTVFYSVIKDPFRVYGLYDYRKQAVFRRLPEEVAASIGAAVASLSLDTAGGRVRFSTDSEFITLRAEMPTVKHLPHMALTGTGGFDLYIDSDGGSRYSRTFKPSADIKNGYEITVKLDNRSMKNITINFPSYNPVNELYIGVSETARLSKGREYVNDLPVVYYGSSITQGACSSRPGLTYQNIIAARYNLDYINLGFSGNARAELPIVNYMAGLDMLAFVSDYDHNAPSAEHLLDTHRRMYDIIRDRHPDIPYIMTSRSDFSLNTADCIKRRDIIIDTYRYARECGDKNVYYLDGEGIFKGPDEDFCTVDGTHPSDIGFLKMSDSIGKLLERALRKTSLAGYYEITESEDVIL